MRHRLIPALAAVALLAPIALPAQQTPEEPSDPRPLVAVDVSLEMAAIERSMDEMAQAFRGMADAMEEIAATGELSVQQQAHLDSIMANLDHVTTVSRRSVDALPSVVERSRTAARESAEILVADLKFWFFVVLGAVAVLLVLGLAAFYWFTLRPLQHTVLMATRHISEMAKAMANTSKSLEVINDTHREVLKLAGIKSESNGPVE